MTTARKLAVFITFILGCVLLIIPYPAIRELINYRNLENYNCTAARNFTYSGKTNGAYRATAIANLTLIIAEQYVNTNNMTTNTTTDSKVVKLRYPGLTTWLPYSFNTRADTVNWFSGLPVNSFQCVSNGYWAYTQPAIPNLPLYYASGASGIVLFCISAFICCMNSVRSRRSQYDYIQLN